MHSYEVTKAQAKSFPISDIVSVTSGYLFHSSKGIAGFYEILSFMCGYEMLTHQIPRLIQVCRPYLLEQDDFLEPLSLELQSGADISSNSELLEELIQRLGAKKLLVNSLPEDVDT